MLRCLALFCLLPALTGVRRTGSMSASLQTLPAPLLSPLPHGARSLSPSLRSARARSSSLSCDTIPPRCRHSVHVPLCPAFSGRAHLARWPRLLPLPVRSVAAGDASSCGRRRRRAAAPRDGPAPARDVTASEPARPCRRLIPPGAHRRRSVAADTTDESSRAAAGPRTGSPEGRP